MLPDNYGQPDTISGVRNDADTAFATANMINQNVSGGDFITIPPKQFGENRILAPQGFKVLGNPTYSALGAVFVLSWQNLDATYNLRIAGYRIYAQQFLNDNQEPTLVGTSAGSPCTVRVIATKAGPVTFWVQPFTVSGGSLPLESCPTCTGIAPNPYFQFDVLDPASGTDATILINNDVVYLKTPNAGIEVYYVAQGIDGVHTSLVPGKLELDSGSTSEGYINAFVLGSHLAQINIYDDPIPGGALPLVQLGENPIATTGTYFGQLIVGGSGLGTAVNKSGSLLLDAKTNTFSISDGTGNQAIYGLALVGAPGGGILQGLRIKVNGTDYTIPLY